MTVEKTDTKLIRNRCRCTCTDRARNSRLCGTPCNNTLHDRESCTYGAMLPPCLVYGPICAPGSQVAKSHCL